MKRVLIPQDIAAVGKQFLRERDYDLRLGCGTDAEVLRAQAADCDAILLRTALITRELLASAPALQVVAKHGIGVDNVDIPAATELGIWVTNAPLSNANTVAEHTIGLMIALARNFVPHDKALRNGDYDIRNRLMGMDLEGKTLGLVGLGRIGSLVAKKAALGLEMKVIGFDAQRKPGDVPDVEVMELNDVLRRADFLSLHIPSTPETHHFMGRRELALMKPSAYFINASRGEVVDESALLEALQNRAIAGAALDVFETEPPPHDHPLFALENVIVTPHSAALTFEATERMALHAAMSIDEVLSGEQPRWPVNQPLQPRNRATKENS